MHAYMLMKSVGLRHTVEYFAEHLSKGKPTKKTTGLNLKYFQNTFSEAISGNIYIFFSMVSVFT